MDTNSSLKPPHPRIGAIPCREMVNVFSESAVKANIHPIFRTIQTFLVVRAWVKNVAWKKNVWIDLHILDKDNSKVMAETLTLQYFGPAGGGGDFFLLKANVCQSGSIGPGWCTARWLDDRKLLYRLYYEVNDLVFTDDILHQHDIESDHHCYQNQDADTVLADLDLDARTVPCQYPHGR